jgi:prevent-host-death family protein
MARPARYNMYEAKTKLSEIVEKARRDGEVILMNRGEPVARVVPFEEPPRERRLGFAKGKIRILRDFDEIPADFEDYV